MVGLKFKRMIEEILDTDSVPGGVRKILEDVLRNYDKYTDYCPKDGQISLIKKSYAINVEGKDVRDVAKQYQLPDSYEGMCIRHSDDGYFIFLEDQKVGRSVSRDEGRKVLAWLHKAYHQIKEVITGVRQDGPAPEWDKQEEELEEPPYFAAGEESNKKKKRPF